MENIQLKYNLLDASSRRKVSDFIDLLLSRKKQEPQKTSTYKQKILGVSVWTEQDLDVFEENKNLFRQWKAEEW